MPTMRRAVCCMLALAAPLASSLSMSTHTHTHTHSHGHRLGLGRRETLVAGGAALVGLGVGVPGAQAAVDASAVAAAAPAAERLDTEITAKVRFRLRIAPTVASRKDDGGRGAVQNEAEEGELVVGLYGNAAPKTVANFLGYCVPPEVPDGAGDLIKQPSLSSAMFWRMEPGELVEAGKIRGLNEMDVAGSKALDYGGKLYPLAKALETNSLSHEKRGLLTRKLDMIGPEFGVTLAPAPQLDGSSVVFGRVLEGGDQILEKIEGIPVYTYKAADASGSVAGEIFAAQKQFYVNAAKSIGDTRASDLRNKLLRKVEIRQLTVLPATQEPAQES